ncbi:MAG: ABC transporter substrate-binding protein [Treponema sp.]|jgi:iron complex transport system substrate-binding protein|nr:ABC transporter substrate-binding protein [Treponema sp.]
MKKYFVHLKRRKNFAACFMVSFAIALGMSVGFASCAKTKTAESASSPVVAAYDPPLVFENYGRTVTVKQKPQKVLTLGPNCTETLVALGLADYIVGNSLKNHSRGPLPEYAEVYKKIPELNYGSATRERVVSSGADFIYGLDWEFGGEGLDIAELEKYGMRVYQNSAQTFEQAYHEILDIGKIFGVESAAQRYIDDQKARVASVGAKIAEKPPVNVLIYDSGNNGVFTCSGVNFETLVVNAAGGKNIFDDLTEKAWITVSYEAVLERNPEVIIIHDYDSPSVEEKLVEIRGNGILAQLDAVKNNRFVTIELESVLPGNRIAYSVEKLAKGLYPEAF